MLFTHLDIVFKQLCNLTDEISAADYAMPLSVLSDNSVGKHMRHIIEFFECFEEGCETGVVNYDTRQRNTEIETSPAYASTKLNDLHDSIASYDFNMPLMLNSMLSGKLLSGTQMVTSSFERELIYTLEHAIHHMAIIEIGIKQELPNVILPENFGVAFSTLEFREKECAQ